jgi:hypothetical protein
MPVEELSDGQHGVGHPQVHVKVGPLEADVDEELAPLITEMWRADVETVMSCQQHDTPEFEKNGLPTSWVWLYMYAPHAENFCSIVAGEYREGKENLYQRVVAEKNSKRNWWYDGHPTNMADKGEPAEIMFDVSVRFPREDLPEVLKRMRKFNAKGKSAFEHAMKWVQIGAVPVDTATVLIADPCSLIPEDKWDEFYTDKLSKVGDYGMLPANNGDAMPSIAATMTGIGDGLYPVEVLIEEGYVAQVRVRFDKRL